MKGKDAIYHIAYGSIDPPSGHNYIKINSQNHAIVESQSTPYLNDDRTIPSQYFIKFREIEGKYYPERVVRKALRFINHDGIPVVL